MKVRWKQGQLLPTFDYTITVLNNLAARDSATKLDVWKKTTLKNCAWSSNTVRNVQGTTVSVGSSFVVRVPKSEDYKPYNEWKETLDGFTFSTGDYVIKGEIEEETVTPNTVLDIVSRHKPEAFEVRLFKDNTGTVELAEHYRIEGV